MCKMSEEVKSLFFDDFVDWRDNMIGNEWLGSDYMLDDVIKSLQRYVRDNNQDDLIQLQKMHQFLGEQLKNTAIEYINRAIQENREQYIYFDLYEDYWRKLHTGEITKEQFENIRQSADMKAFSEYISSIRYRYNNTAIMIIVDVVLKTKSVFKYQSILNRAVTAAKKQIKWTKQQTNCTLKTLIYLSNSFLKELYLMVYDVFNPDEYNLLNDTFDRTMEERKKLMDVLDKNELSEEEEEKIYMRMNELVTEEKEVSDVYYAHAYNRKKDDNVQSILKSLAKLYPPETETVTQIIDKPYLPFYANGDSNSLMYNIIKASKNSKLNTTGEKSIATYSYSKEEGTVITDLSLLEISDYKGKAVKITDGHKKIFLYACNLMNRTKNSTIEINYNDFLKLKGTEQNAFNRKELKKKIAELNTIYWKIKRNGKETEIYKLMTPLKFEKNSVTIRIEGWNTGDLGYNAYIDEKAFMYNEPKAAIGGAFSLSQKLCNEIKMNWNNSRRIKDGWLSLKVEGIVKDILGFPDEIFNKKGYSYVEDRLNELIEEMETAEDSKWQFRYRLTEHTSKEEFFNDYLEFRNDELMNLYKNNMEKATEKKSKKKK